MGVLIVLVAPVAVGVLELRVKNDDFWIDELVDADDFTRYWGD